MYPISYILYSISAEEEEEEEQREKGGGAEGDHLLVIPSGVCLLC